MHAKYNKLLKRNFITCYKGHSTSKRRPLDVDITLIRQKTKYQSIPRHFDMLFQYNVDG